MLLLEMYNLYIVLKVNFYLKLYVVEIIHKTDNVTPNFLFIIY